MFLGPFALWVPTTRAAQRLLLAMLCLGVALLPTLVVSSGYAQDVRVESNVQASPVNGGWYPWYELAAGPADPDHLIVCGSRWDVHDNAFYGFLYSSPDGGRTWHTALEDKSSAWVTEHSCAFGANGTAYLLSEASKVIDGIPHHDMGTTRIFVSHDAGRSWAEAVRTGWADYSASVVDTQSGPNQNRLYSFFHDFEFNPPDRPWDENRRDASRISVMDFKAGETRVDGPLRNPRMDSLHYHGAYPERVFLLKGGELLALYIAALRTKEGLDDTINAVRLDGDHLTLADPVTVVRAAITSARCYPSQLAAAYDSSADTVYLAYSVSTGGRCGFVLRTSVDEGRTWSAEQQVPELGARSPGIFAPALAFNNAGILGLMWREGPVSDCWYFSASRDGGKTFTHAQSLSQCSATQDLLAGNWNASLRMSAMRSVIDGPIAPPSYSGPHYVLVLNVVDGRNAIWRNSGALTTTSDGVFHAVWVERGQGEGLLRSARVIVGNLRETQIPPAQLPKKETHNITQDIALLYGGDQHYDLQNGTLTVDVILKNASKESLRGPLFMKVLALDGEVGKVEIANASNQARGPGAIWDLSEALLDGVLLPGATTKPYSLVFRLLEEYTPTREAEVLSMQFEVLTYDARAGSER